MDLNDFIAEYDVFIKTRSRILARNAIEADELSQKAFIIMWQQSGRLSAMTSPEIKAFLAKSIKNAFIDLRRKERRVVSYDAQSYDIQAYDTQSIKGLASRFENAVLDKLTIMSVIHTLPSMEQDIIFKTYFMGMDSTEVSKQLNIPAATVRSKKARAQQKLKKILEER